MGKKKGGSNDKPKARAPMDEGEAMVAAGERDASPAEQKLSGKDYDRELRKLHVELVKLQRWVVHKGLKVCVLFEGRDGARSWYNRAGVERVMGFCTEAQAKDFLQVVPLFEKLMVESGIILLKYWLEVSPEEQTRRLASRIDDGRKTWKLSPMDLKSYDRWDDYTKARDEMFAATDSDWAPWYVARSEDKKRVRLNVISHLLEHVPYKSAPAVKVKLPKRKIGRYKSIDYPSKYVPERF